MVISLPLGHFSCVIVISIFGSGRPPFRAVISTCASGRILLATGTTARAPAPLDAPSRPAHAERAINESTTTIAGRLRLIMTPLLSAKRAKFPRAMPPNSSTAGDLRGSSQQRSVPPEQCAAIRHASVLGRQVFSFLASASSFESRRVLLRALLCSPASLTAATG